MNSPKFILLNRRQWQENKKAYRTGLLGIAGILSFLFFIAWHWKDSFGGDVHRGIFLIGLFAGGCIFAASLLKDISHKAKSMWLIGIPASAGEKLFIAIFYGIVLYLLAYLILFYTTEGFVLWLTKTNSMPIEHMDLFKNGFYNFLFSFINFQLLIFMGSLSFRRGALIKTILLMILFFSLSSTLNNQLLGLMTGEKNINGGGIYDYFQFVHEAENVYVYLPENAQLITNIFFHYLLPCILYYIAYLKFRETEI